MYSFIIFVKNFNNGESRTNYFKMGESVSESLTIISWTKDIGETIELDETIVEMA